MAISGIGCVYSFSGGGSLAGIRKQADAIKSRVGAESEALGGKCAKMLDIRA